MESERMTRGREHLARLNPKAEAALHAALDDIAPDMVEMVVAFGYGDIYARPGLAPQDRQVATIAALTALGNAEPQLSFHIDAGLTAGLSPRDIVETLYVTTVFAGFPAGLNALTVARRRGVDIGIDQIADADELTRIVEGAKKTGVVYVGGGVPKNFIQQTQVIASMHKIELGGHAYAVQYTTDAPHWGGLSGCTFEEAISVMYSASLRMKSAEEAWKGAIVPAKSATRQSTLLNSSSYAKTS